MKHTQLDLSLASDFSAKSTAITLHPLLINGSAVASPIPEATIDFIKINLFLSIKNVLNIPFPAPVITAVLPLKPDVPDVVLTK